MDSETGLLFALVFSLVASSFCISWIVNDYADNPPCGPGSSCAPIELYPSMTEQTGVPSVETYTSASTFDPNLTYPMDDTLHGYGTWTQDGTGYHITASGSLFGGDPILLLNGIIPTGKLYTVTYKIDNQPNGEFYITPRRTLANGQTAIDIRMVFAQDGVHIKEYPVPLLSNDDIIFISAPGVQDTIAGGSTFIVYFDEGLNQVTVWKDGNSIFATGGLPDEGNVIPGQGLYYGGVGSREVGFNVISTDATRDSSHNAIGDVGDAAGWWWEGITDLSESIIPGSGGVIEMLALMGRVVVWSLPEEIFPLWLNMLLIKTQVIAIIYIAARLGRGGG